MYRIKEIIRLIGGITLVIIGGVLTAGMLLSTVVGDHIIIGLIFPAIMILGILLIRDWYKIRKANNEYTR